jgi:flagellar biogenesis protein FliO
MSAVNWTNLAWRNLLDRTAELTRRTPRSLVLRETLSLGEKRFVALIECDGRRFLIGGSGQSINLLSNLPEQTS